MIQQIRIIIFRKIMIELQLKISQNKEMIANKPWVTLTIIVAFI
jgi:hypothetical protein